MSRKAYALATAGAGSSLAPFMVAGLIVSLPAIAEEFLIDASGLSWLTSIFFLSAAAFLIPVGRMADLWGIKRVFRAGIVVYIIGALICSLAPDFQILVAGRFLTGIGGAAVFATTIALVSLVVTGKDRGHAIGINISAMVSGFSLGFFLGGLMVYYSGWRSIFFVVIPVAIVSLFLSTRFRGECALSRGQKPDVPGMGLSVGTILLLMTGFSIITSHTGIILFICGCFLAIFFVVWEYRNSNPMLDVRSLLKNQVFVLTNITVFIYYMGGFASIFLISLYLQLVKGLDPRYAGLILLIQPLMMTLAIFGGNLSDRYNPWKIALIGLILSLVPLVFFTTLDQASSLPAIFIALAVLGLGIALFQPSVARAVVSSVGPDLVGMASGSVETMRLTGMTISTAISSIAFVLIMGTSVITPGDSTAFIGSMRLLFIVYSIISLFSFITILFLRGACKRARSLHSSPVQGENETIGPPTCFSGKGV